MLPGKWIARDNILNEAFVTVNWSNFDPLFVVFEIWLNLHWLYYNNVYIYVYKYVYIATIHAFVANYRVFSMLKLHEERTENCREVALSSHYAIYKSQK